MSWSGGDVGVTSAALRLIFQVSAAESYAIGTQIVFFTAPDADGRAIVVVALGVPMQVIVSLLAARLSYHSDTSDRHFSSEGYKSHDLADLRERSRRETILPIRSERTATESRTAPRREVPPCKQRSSLSAGSRPRRSVPMPPTCCGPRENGRTSPGCRERGGEAVSRGRTGRHGDGRRSIW